MVFLGVEEARVLMETRIEDARREGERRALLKSVRGSRPGWLRKQIGRHLVVLGQRLERHSVPSHLLPECRGRP